MLIDSISGVPTGAVMVESLPDASERSKAFGGVLENALHQSRTIRFSNHAQKRLEERNIVFSEEDIARIALSTDDALEKGSKEALFLMDRLALVVGIPNRTVITVLEPHEQENTIFTHIDSVVMVAKNGSSSY